MRKTVKSRDAKQAAATSAPAHPPASTGERLLIEPELMTALRALLPPYDHPDSRKDFAKVLRKMFKCEAVSYFLVARAQDGKAGEERMELQIFSHDGYKNTPKSYKLGTSKVFLTTHVFEVRRETFNQSSKYIREHSEQYIHEHLDQYKGAPPQPIPCSNRCEGNLHSERFDNILVVPFRTVEGRYAGILKFENREGRNSTQPFPEEDVAKAEDLARLIGVFVGPRDHSRLWIAWAKQEQKNLQTFVEILAKHAPAECASVFIRKDGVLRNSGGVGYKLDSYKTHEYRLPASGERPAHLTTWVAENGPVRKTIQELQEAKANGILPFSNACEEYIGSPLRDLFLLPVETDGVTVAVVKMENKLPPDTHFDELDERIYSEFCNHAVKSLLPSKKRLRSPLAGVQYLIDKIGPPPAHDLHIRDQAKYDDVLLRVHKVHLEMPDQVTIDVIAEYFGFARGTWYTRLNAAQKRLEQAQPPAKAKPAVKPNTAKKKRTP